MANSWLNTKQSDCDFFEISVKFGEGDPAFNFSVICGELVKVSDSHFDFYALVENFKDSISISKKNQETIGELPKQLPIRFKLTTDTIIEKYLIERLSVSKCVTGNLSTSQPFNFLQTIEKQPDFAASIQPLLSTFCVFQPTENETFNALKKGKASSKGFSKSGYTSKPYPEVVAERITELAKLTGTDLKDCKTESDKINALSFHFLGTYEGMIGQGQTVLEILKIVMK